MTNITVPVNDQLGRLILFLYNQTEKDESTLTCYADSKKILSHILSEITLAYLERFKKINNYYPPESPRLTTNMGRKEFIKLWGEIEKSYTKKIISPGYTIKIDKNKFSQSHLIDINHDLSAMYYQHLMKGNGIWINCNSQEKKLFELQILFCDDFGFTVPVIDKSLIRRNHFKDIKLFWKVCIMIYELMKMQRSNTKPKAIMEEIFKALHLSSNYSVNYFINQMKNIKDKSSMVYKSNLEINYYLIKCLDPFFIKHDIKIGLSRQEIGKKFHLNKSALQYILQKSEKILAK